MTNKGRLAAALSLILAAVSPLEAQNPATKVDQARSTSGYGALVPVRGDATASAIPVSNRIVQARAAARYCEALKYAAATDSDALLVWRKSKIELAREFAPYDAASKTWSASMSKTLVALALGIAIREKSIASVDDPVSRYLTEWTDDAHKRITFRNLLAMTSGLGRPAAGSKSASALLFSEDLVAQALALPVVQSAGTQYDYNTANVTLVMEAIARATGMKFADFLSSRLWKPLGASDALLAGDSTGHVMPSLFATARDWLRIGILIEQRGAWAGRQIVPASWIDAMTKPGPLNPNYGWLVWLGSPPGTKRSYGPKVAFQAIHSKPFLAPDVIFLDGFGGQRVYIVRSARLVVVRTGGTSVDWDDAVLPNAMLKPSTAQRACGV